MSDINLVIKIPKETVNAIKDNAMFAGSIPSEILWDVTSAIANGTPLPKGHGRLIDADALRVCFYDSSAYQEGENFCYYSVKDINNAPTIIEADEGVSEE